MVRSRFPALAFLLASCPIQAANLDVTAAYGMRAISYENLNLNSVPASRNNHSFISDDASLGFAVRRITLEQTPGGEDMTMDVGITLRALGVTGSSTTLQSAPFQSIASHYPSSNLTPFIQNAYLKATNFLGYPVEATFGRQTFRLGSGLLLDDDGAGLTGVTLRGGLPWWGIKLEGFVFADRDASAPGLSAPGVISDYGGNPLTLFGFAVDLPTDGVWQLNQLFEREQGLEPVYGCTMSDAGGNAVTDTPGNPANCYSSKVWRSFTSIRYNLSYGPFVFDGEAAIERGMATPASNPDPDFAAAGAVAPRRITYNGNAQVVRAKWKQSLPRMTGEGIARLGVARGSGDNPGTRTIDEAFFPSHGHQFDGLDRSGFGDFFGATPYNAFGGTYGSTSTASGLPTQASGIIALDAGFTPPSYKNFTLDVDYYLFQAERINSGSRTLGTEWDFRLRRNVQDRFGVSATAALFSAGPALNPNGAKAQKYALNAFCRF